MFEGSHIKLHCIGDSHTAFFTGYNKIQPAYPEVVCGIAKNVFTYRLGSPLAYNLCESDSTLKSKEKVFSILQTLNPQEDIILLSFGEVDCRAHLIKQSELNNLTIAESVHICVERYLKVVEEILKMQFRVVVWNAVPTSYGFEDIDFEYPYYGTYVERNLACILFNEALKKRSVELGFYYLGVYELIINKELFSMPKYYFDRIHLSNRLLPLVFKLLQKEFPNLEINSQEVFKIKIRGLLFRIGIEHYAEKFITRLSLKLR